MEDLREKQSYYHLKEDSDEMGGDLKRARNHEVKNQRVRKYLRRP